MFQHSTAVELKVSPEYGQAWNQSQSQKISPNENCRNKTFAEESDFVSVTDFLQCPFPPITIQPWISWPEVPFPVG